MVDRKVSRIWLERFCAIHTSLFDSFCVFSCFHSWVAKYVLLNHTSTNSFSYLFSSFLWSPRSTSNNLKQFKRSSTEKNIYSQTLTVSMEIDHKNLDKNDQTLTVTMCFWSFLSMSMLTVGVWLYMSCFLETPISFFVGSLALLLSAVALFNCCSFRTVVPLRFAHV